MKTKKKKEILEKVDIFYFSKSKEVLIIPHNYTNGSSILNTLVNNLTEINDLCKDLIYPNKTKVYCISDIQYSRRYKNKWAFWFDFKTPILLPQKTVILGHDWDILSWIND